VERLVLLGECLRLVTYLIRYSIPADSSRFLDRHGLTRKNPQVHVSKATIQWGSIQPKRYLLYKE
jgi:hypothetical protein